MRISTRHQYPKHELNALIVSGGDDIDPALYGEEADPEAEYDAARDALEQEHISFALASDVPVLGICRGYQLINVTRGGNLYGDIRDMRRLTSNRGTILPRKRVNLHSHSLVSQVLKRKNTRVNSLHHQAVRTVGEGLTAVGWDRDNLVQAVESESGSAIVGVQWHPEYLFYLPHQHRLFRWLVEQANNQCLT